QRAITWRRAEGLLEFLLGLPTKFEGAVEVSLFSLHAAQQVKQPGVVPAVVPRDAQDRLSLLFGLPEPFHTVSAGPPPSPARLCVLHGPPELFHRACRAALPEKSLAQVASGQQAGDPVFLDERILPDQLLHQLECLAQVGLGLTRQAELDLDAATVEQGKR